MEGQLQAPAAHRALPRQATSWGTAGVEKDYLGEGSSSSAALTFKCTMFCSILGFFLPTR